MGRQEKREGICFLVGFFLGAKKKKRVLLQTIFSTSLQHQSGLKTENQHQTKKKAPKMASKPKNGKPKYATQMSSMHALIPIDEILNDIGSHVDIKAFHLLPFNACFNVYM